MVSWAAGLRIGSVRKRVLDRAVLQANVLLEGTGYSALPEHLTPHFLRRTFASVLFAVPAAGLIGASALSRHCARPASGLPPVEGVVRPGRHTC